MPERLYEILPSLLLAAFCITSMYIVNGTKYSFKKTVAITTTLMLLIVALNIGLFLELDLSTYENWFLLTIFIPEALIVAFLGKKTGINAITGIIHSYITFFIVFLFKNVVLYWTDEIWPEYIVYLIFFPVLLYYLKFYYSKLQNEIESLLPRYIYLMLLYGIALLIEIAIYRSLINATEARVLRLEIFGVAIISIYVISVGLFYLIIKQYRKRIIELNDEKIVKRELKNLKDHYKLREMKDKELRILRHDMKHILINVSTLIKNGKYIDALDFTNEYVTAIDNTSEIKYCNDQIINSILDYYTQICKDKKINLNIKVNNFEDVLTIPSYEMGVFISNCLDNAVNATSKLEENRFIDFTFLNNDGRLILQIKNSFNGAIILGEDNKPTSMTEGHGIGTNSINWFANRNGLLLNYDITDKTFTISVLFKEI